MFCGQKSLFFLGKDLTGVLPDHGVRLSLTLEGTSEQFPKTSGVVSHTHQQCSEVQSPRSFSCNLTDPGIEIAEVCKCVRVCVCVQIQNTHVSHDQIRHKATSLGWPCSWKSSSWSKESVFCRGGCRPPARSRAATVHLGQPLRFESPPY